MGRPSLKITRVSDPSKQNCQEDKTRSKRDNAFISDGVLSGSIVALLPEQIFISPSESFAVATSCCGARVSRSRKA